MKKAAETVITNAGLNAASGGLSDAQVISGGDQ